MGLDKRGLFFFYLKNDFAIEKPRRVWYNSMDFVDQLTLKEIFIYETWYR